MYYNDFYVDGIKIYSEMDFWRSARKSRKEKV
jgi:hypothetical protein